MRALIAIVLVAGLGLGVVASAADGGAPARARATALLATGSVGPQLETTSDGGAEERRAGSLQTGALRIRDGETVAQATTGNAPSAQATAVARSIDALDGMVTAYGVRREVTVRPGRTSYDGRVTGLRIAGETIGDVAGSWSFELPDGAGTVHANRGDAGLRIVLTKPAGGQPAGTDLRIAVVGGEAIAARAPKATPQPRATPESTPRPAKRRAKVKRRPVPKSVPAPERLRTGRYAFPVYGDGVSVADDFGGPRQIGPHQGNDIFAPFGSPALAVADGTLHKVGTLPIAGNRLWLVTDSGDAFFYAHLSSFSELAETGRRVRAGEVLGFVGNTGDAEPTPPHVHFEIHPRGMDGPAADPHEVLLAWQQGRDVAPSAWLRHVGADTAERPGALVEVRDFIAGE